MNGLNRDNYFYPPARRARGAMGWNQIQQKSHRDARRPKMSQQPRIAIKRITVNIAYYSLREIFHEFNIPCVKRTFGTGIVRICCRSLIQLDNITLIMKELLEGDLIEEIGMPLEYAYKMKTLVLFIKPTDFASTEKLAELFENSSFHYHHIVINVKRFTFLEEKNSKKTTNLPKTKCAPLDKLSKVIIFLTIISILLTSELMYHMSKDTILVTIITILLTSAIFRIQ